MGRHLESEPAQEFSWQRLSGLRSTPTLQFAHHEIKLVRPELEQQKERCRKGWPIEQTRPVDIAQRLLKGVRIRQVHYKTERRLLALSGSGLGYLPA
jgi:hypothetical protein